LCYRLFSSVQRARAHRVRHLLGCPCDEASQGFTTAKMAISPTQGGRMRDLRNKTEALQIPLRPLPREAPEGDAQINWAQALLRKQGYCTKGKGQESQTPPPRSWWPITAPGGLSPRSMSVMA
jgi:hypothetical protein